MSVGVQWLNDILREFGEYADAGEVVEEPGVNLPGWVRTIDRELTRRLFPVRIRKGEKPTPRKIGQLLGQTYANIGWILDCLRRPETALRDRFERSTKEFLEQDYEESFAANIRDKFDADLVHVQCAYRHVLNRSLLLATARPFNEAAEFFDGFAQAVHKRASDDSLWEEKYSTTAAYYVLRRDWEFVESFKNVSDLHTFLQFKLGRNAAGDLERTRSLAKRLKLKLAPPGRPSKNWVKVTD
jgi:hypothetical protein